MRRKISSILILAFLLCSCASSVDILTIARENHFIPGITSFEKATNLVSVDPTTALEHYVEAKVRFESFAKEVEGNPQAVAEVRKAKTYIGKTIFGIEFAKAQEEYENLKNEEICKEVSKNKFSVSHYREEYNQLLIPVKAFKYEYLESESKRLVKNVEEDLSRLEECVTSANRTPVAVTGGNPTVNVNSVVTLDGSKSYDPDGGHLTFNWVQAAGPKVSVSNPTDSQLTFTPEIPGTYVFSLVVSDGKLKSEPRKITTTVEDLKKSPTDLPDKSPTPPAPQTPTEPPQDILYLGTFTHNEITGTAVIVTNYRAKENAYNTIIKKHSTMTRDESKTFSLDVTGYGDLEVIIPPGYNLRGGGLRFTGQKIFEGDPTRYKRFIREKISVGTQINDLKIVRKQNSPDDFRFIFKLYPR